MNRSQVLLGQAVCFFSPEAYGRGEMMPIYDLVRSIESHFKFVEAPRERRQIDFKNGVRFIGGSFNGHHLERLELYGNGMICEMNTSTDICDKLLDETIALVSSIVKTKINEETFNRIYTSDLEFEIASGIFAYFVTTDWISNQLSKYWSSYGHQPREFSVTGLTMHVDTNLNEGLTPSHFVIERRIGQSFSKNLYYSRAPLKSSDHLKLLADIEKAIETMATSVRSIPA